jgi:hypothetical protein
MILSRARDDAHHAKFVVLRADDAGDHRAMAKGIFEALPVRAIDATGDVEIGMRGVDTRVHHRHVALTVSRPSPDFVLLRSASIRSAHAGRHCREEGGLKDEQAGASAAAAPLND